jgi:hypothetical protein
MSSGKIAVPPGGGGLSKRILKYLVVEKIVNRVSQNWLPRENRHVPTTKETPN